MRSLSRASASSTSMLARVMLRALFSPVIAGGGPLTRCAPDCPQNALQMRGGRGSVSDRVAVNAPGH